jgi:hypothetical protein
MHHESHSIETAVGNATALALPDVDQLTNTDRERVADSVLGSLAFTVSDVVIHAVTDALCDSHQVRLCPDWRVQYYVGEYN